jgi:hypothetical protein
MGDSQVVKFLSDWATVRTSPYFIGIGAQQCPRQECLREHSKFIVL